MGAESTFTFRCFFCTTVSRSLPSPPRCYLPLQARSSRDTGKSPSSLGLADFDLLRVIGRGSYAKVLLVQLKKTERIYAMKVVKKELVNDDEVKDAGVSRTTKQKIFFYRHQYYAFLLIGQYLSQCFGLFTLKNRERLKMGYLTKFFYS